MKTFIVDSFTNKPYSGNPAGVCIIDNEVSDDLMVKIAREINHSETAFLLKLKNRYSLRWFTPKTEVDLCGHATLATAHVLFETGLAAKESLIEFDTKSGILTARYINGLIELNFPQLSVTKCGRNKIIEKAFDINPVFIGKNDDLYLVEIDNTEKLKQLNPDFQLLQKSDRGEFLITAQGHDRFDFHSRFFGPGVGINEDPVTGSAHCILAPYWAGKLNKTTMLAFQASERTGFLECELAENKRVLLRGRAVTMNQMKEAWKKL